MERPLLDYESAHESIGGGGGATTRTSSETTTNTTNTTILLIHGSGASGSDWDLVCPFLTSYHLLMPSLFTEHSLALCRREMRTMVEHNGGGRATWQQAYINLLADLVKRKAKNGRAHVVGLSLGASLAIGFALCCSDLTLSLFGSGLPEVPSDPTRFFPLWLWRGALLAAMTLEDLLSRPLGPWFLQGEVSLHRGGWDGKGAGANLEKIDAVIGVARGLKVVPIEKRLRTSDSALDSTTSPQQQQQRKPFRIFLLAATRRPRCISIGDSPTWTIQIAKRLAGGFEDEDESTNTSTSTVAPPSSSSEGAGSSRHDDGDGESQAAVTEVEISVIEAPRMFHPWNRQAPEVFAECVKSLVEGEGGGGGQGTTTTPLPSDHTRVLWSVKRPA